MVAAAGAAAGAGADTTPTTPVQTTLVPWLSTWAYKVVPFGTGPVVAASRSKAGFAAGRGGFGTPGFCPLDQPPFLNTFWPVLTDVVIRRKLELPDNTVQLIVRIAIDNDVQVFVDGRPVSPLNVRDGCAFRENVIVNVPAAPLEDGEIVLTIVGRDRGSLTYLDSQVDELVLPDENDNNNDGQD